MRFVISSIIASDKYTALSIMKMVMQSRGTKMAIPAKMPIKYAVNLPNKSIYLPL